MSFSEGFHVNISKNGEEQDYRLFCQEGDQNKGVTFENNNQKMMINYGVGGSLRLSTSPTGKSGNWSFFDLFGNTLSFEVDLSNVPCGLNATFYSIVLEDGQKYRDACATFPSTTELDFMEANRYVWHSTFHRQKNDCGSAPPLGYGGTIRDPKYLFHDLSGTVTDSSKLYGPGTDFVINTLLPFQVSISFIKEIKEENEILVAISVVLSQQHCIGQSITEENEEYKGWLKELGEEIKMKKTNAGNVMVWSLWTGGLNWLESPPCPSGSSPKCTTTSCQYAVSNISIKTI